MERLTKKINDYWATNNKAQIYYLDTNESVFIGNAIDKLAEFEDFMEKYNVESMEDLELRLEDVEHYAYNCNVEQIDEIIKLKQENQAHKERWQKLKEWLMYTLEEKQSSPKYYKFNNVLDKMQELEEDE